MRYVGKVYRPPSEAWSYLLQATIGCSWNRCTYCDMYSDKPVFRVRPLGETLADVAEAGRRLGGRVEKVFVTDGDALGMDLATWRPLLAALRGAFPRLRQVSCYATARNVLEKTDAELATLRADGLSLLYIGPESGDDVVLKRIAKGATAAEHAVASRRAKAAGMKVSAIFLLGCGGVERSAEHARASGSLATAMDPDYLAALTLTVVPGTPLARLQERGGFVLPGVLGLLGELRAFVAEARPTSALLRTNHASNYLPIGGRLPDERAGILEVIDLALAGRVALRVEGERGL